jgi:hypothetical protein
MTEKQEKVLISEERAFTLYRLEGCILFFDYRDNILVELEDVKRPLIYMSNIQRVVHVKY